MQYKALNGWTKEKMIEKLRQHIPDNGPCMLNNGEGCSYLNNEGKRCAAGAFLPDDFEKFESTDAIAYLVEKYPNLEYKLPLTAYQLSMLQNIHDSFSKYGTCESKLGDNPQDACVAWVEINVVDDSGSEGVIELNVED